MSAEREYKAHKTHFERWLNGWIFRIIDKIAYERRKSGDKSKNSTPKAIIAECFNAAKSGKKSTHFAFYHIYALNLCQIAANMRLHIA